MKKKAPISLFVSGKSAKKRFRAPAAEAFKHTRFSRANLGLFVLIFGAIGAYMLLSSSAAGVISINAPASAQACSTRFSSEDVWPGYFYDQAPPAGGPTLTQRIDALGLDYWRVQAVQGYNDASNSLPFPAAYTGTDGHSVTAWNFATLDKVLSDGPATATRLLDLTSPPDSLWTGTGTLPANGVSSKGTLADQTYGALAQYYANVVKYFRTGISESNAGATVTYTATSLTDSSKDFTAYGGGGYAVTATVLDANGFPDWETASITSITNAGHTLNFGSWSNNTLGAKTVPAAGAAYNLASTTPPVTLPVNARPWPRPPSVGNVQYYELFNESDLSNSFFPRSSPNLTGPVPTLTAVNVTGGTLTPGTTYAYRMTGVGINTGESLPAAEVSLTLPTGMNAIQIDWSATTNLGLSPFAYRIYGRAAGAEKAMVVVGRDAASGFSFTDKGTITPSGNLPTTDNTGGLQVWRPREYTKMWNAVAPAIKAVDATAKIVGPVISNPASLAPLNVNTTVVTTGPADNSWKDSTDYIPYLMAHGVPSPDVVSYHSYGNSNGSASTDASYFSGLNSAISDFKTVDVPVIGSTPAWNTESNIDAGFLDNTDFRAVTQLGSAWLADEFTVHCLQAPSTQQLFQFEVANTNTWNLFGQTPPANCYPQPSCLNSKPQEPNLEYWMIYWMSRYFPPGSKIVPVSGVPAGFAAFAGQAPGSTKISMVVVNIQTGASPGVGTAGNVAIQLNGATSSATKQVTIDGTTDVINGPSETSLGGVSTVNLNMNGYGVALLSFDTAGSPGDTTPPVISGVASSNITSNAATIGWTTDENSDSQVDYGPTASYGSSTTLDGSLVTSHSQALSGLSASTIYHYRVKSKDASGNLATGSDNTFITSAGGGGGSGIHVVGNLLKNASGSTVTLRGVNRSGSEYACVQGWGIFDGPNATNDDAQIPLMKSWGINSVNIPFNEDCWLGINGVPAAYSGTNYINALKHEVATLEANDMIPVLALFWTAPGTQQALDHGTMPDSDHAPALWQSVANNFKNDPNVIFRIDEEPHPANTGDGAAAWACWKNGDYQYDTSNTLNPVSHNVNCSEGFSTVGMQSLINIVRGTGATNVIAVPGTQYANSMTNFLNATYKVSDSLNPSQLMAAVDTYPDGNSCGTTTCYDSKYAPVAAVMPFMSGEVGDDPNCAITNMSSVDTYLNWLDAHNAGYLAWTWDTWGGSCQLISSYSTGATKSPWGTDFKAHLASVGSGGGLGSGGGGGGVSGDLNGDGHVTILDLSILLSHYGQSATASQGDINTDGTVTILDLSILLSHYGT